MLSAFLYLNSSPGATAMMPMAEHAAHSWSQDFCGRHTGQLLYTEDSIPAEFCTGPPHRLQDLLPQTCIGSQHQQLHAWPRLCSPPYCLHKMKHVQLHFTAMASKSCVWAWHSFTHSMPRAVCLPVLSAQQPTAMLYIHDLRGLGAGSLDMATGLQ